MVTAFVIKYMEIKPDDSIDVLSHSCASIMHPLSVVCYGSATLFNITWKNGTVTYKAIIELLPRANCSIAYNACRRVRGFISALFQLLDIRLSSVLRHKMAGGLIAPNCEQFMFNCIRTTRLSAVVFGPREMYLLDVPSKRTSGAVYWRHLDVT